MPKIEVVDMKKEVNVISERLLRGIENNLKNNNQTLIFINKRGYAPLIICKNCAYSKICEKCNTSLVLHNYRKPNKSYLLCHHCNYKEFFVNICPKCNTKESFTFPGFGIEKIYEEIKKLFPKAKTCLLSSDSIKDINNFKTTISDITANKINIILGTQLISKGHNFPSLKTVGILNIDNIINDFDFRSFEKTFQQVVQVSGRAGRKKLKGDVIIQTLQPQHPIIRLCQKQDIYDFMKWELKSRMENQQPPYVNYISLIFSSKTEKFVSNFASKTTELIKNNFKQLSIFGPAPAILYRKNLYFRYRLLIKIEKSGQSQNKIKSFLMQIKIPNYIKLYIDVDPINFI